MLYVLIENQIFPGSVPNIISKSQLIRGNPKFFLPFPLAFSCFKSPCSVFPFQITILILHGKSEKKFSIEFSHPQTSGNPSFLQSSHFNFPISSPDRHQGTFQRHFVTPRMMEFNPGQRPPQVTIAALTWEMDLGKFQQINTGWGPQSIAFSWFISGFFRWFMVDITNQFMGIISGFINPLITVGPHIVEYLMDYSQCQLYVLVYIYIQYIAIFNGKSQHIFLENPNSRSIDQMISNVTRIFDGYLGYPKINGYLLGYLMYVKIPLESNSLGIIHIQLILWIIIHWEIQAYIQLIGYLMDDPQYQLYIYMLYVVVYIYIYSSHICSI